VTWHLIEEQKKLYDVQSKHENMWRA